VRRVAASLKISGDSDTQRAYGRRGTHHFWFSSCRSWLRGQVGSKPRQGPSQASPL